MKLKALIEKRNSLIDEAEGLLQAAETETRAMSAEEKEKFDGLQAEIRALGETIAAAEQAEEQERSAAVPAGDDAVAKEDRAFADYVLGRESRAGEQNMTMGNNGAIIPSTIANRIIKAVRDRWRAVPADRSRLPPCEARRLVSEKHCLRCRGRYVGVKATDKKFTTFLLTRCYIM